MTPGHGQPTPAGRRRLSYGVFAVIVVVYLAIIQVGGLLVTNAAGIDSDHGLVTTRNVLLSMWVPVGAALVFTFAVVAALGWSRPSSEMIGQSSGGSSSCPSCS